MKIVLVTEFYYPHAGGITEHVHHLGRSLLRSGHQVALVTSHVAEAARRPNREIVEGLEVLRIGIGIPVESNGSQSRVTVGWNLDRKMREIVAGADLVHVHSPLFPTLAYTALKAARRHGIPTVGTFHTHFAGSKGLDAFRPIIHKYARAIDCCIAVSPSAMRSVKNYVKAPFLIIPNGVDVPGWSSGVPRPELAGRRNILFLGRLDPRNDVEMLIETFTQASDKRDDLRLVLVGDGPRRAEYEASVPRRLRDRVLFAGLQTDLSTRAGYMASAHVVAFSARIVSHPQTLIEAMAANRPVVAYDIEGVRELVDSGREGYLVPVDDTAAFADALLTTLSDEPARLAMGARAGQRVLPFDWSTVSARIENVYRALIAGKPLPEAAGPPTGGHLRA